MFFFFSFALHLFHCIYFLYNIFYNNIFLKYASQQSNNPVSDMTLKIALNEMTLEAD